MKENAFCNCTNNIVLLYNVVLNEIIAKATNQNNFFIDQIHSIKSANFLLEYKRK